MDLSGESEPTESFEGLTKNQQEVVTKMLRGMAQLERRQKLSSKDEIDEYFDNLKRRKGGSQRKVRESFDSDLFSPNTSFEDLSPSTMRRRSIVPLPYIRDSESRPSSMYSFLSLSSPSSPSSRSLLSTTISTDSKDQFPHSCLPTVPFQGEFITLSRQETLIKQNSLSLSHTSSTSLSSITENDAIFDNADVAEQNKKPDKDSKGHKRKFSTSALLHNKDNTNSNAIRNVNRLTWTQCIIRLAFIIPLLAWSLFRKRPR